MKKISIISFFLSILILSSCNLSNRKTILTSLQTEVDTKSINFQFERLDSALNLAKKQDKNIFIYFTSDGCSPCVKIDKIVFTDTLVMDFFNTNFVCGKSHWKSLSSSPDVTDEEKSLNKSMDLLMKNYGISGTPSFVVIDYEGDLIHKSIGYKSQSELIQFGKDALSNDRNYAAIETKIKKGDYSFETVKVYLEGTPTYSSFLDNIFGNTNQKVIENYFNTQKQSDWNSENNWLIINKYINDFDSEQFQYLLHNRHQFYKNFSKINVDYKTYRVLNNYEFNGGDIKNLNYPLADLIVKRKGLKAKKYSDLNSYAKDFNDMYTEYYFLFDYEINTKSWEIYEKSNKNNNNIEIETIKIAANWMKLVTSYRDKDKNYIDTYEKLQHELKTRDRNNNTQQI